MIKTMLAALSLSVLFASAASAEVPVDGAFVADRACRALQSIRRNANPGELQVEPGRSYRAVAKNREDATFYRLEVDGSLRWVASSCGTMEGAGSKPASAPARPGTTTHVLAMSWQAAFCASRRAATECATRRYDATALALHGLWPQPIGKDYCGVDRRLVAADRASQWDRLPAPELSGSTREELAAVMPGAQSGLERHQWIKHGTCFGGSADAYFRRSAELARQINAGPVREAFAANVGRTVSAETIRAAFDRAFGPGAGDRVTVSCDDRRNVSEILVGLAGDVAGDAPVGALIHAAAPAKPGCQSGRVTAAP